jgi:large subunit ribosomal protein L28
MASFSFKYPVSAHIGNKVSHAKNRSKRHFKYNLHTVTVVVDGQKQRLKVPTKFLRQLKKSGITTHYSNMVEKAKDVVVEATAASKKTTKKATVAKAKKAQAKTKTATKA